MVVDEVVGHVGVAAVPAADARARRSRASWLFRVMDVVKPYPARQLERPATAGWGIMADDLMAGVYANLLLRDRRSGRGRAA